MKPLIEQASNRSSSVISAARFLNRMSGFWVFYDEQIKGWTMPCTSWEYGIPRHGKTPMSAKAIIQYAKNYGWKP